MGPRPSSEPVAGLAALLAHSLPGSVEGQVPGKLAAVEVRFGARVTSARRNPHVDGEVKVLVPAYLLGVL